MNGAGEGNRTLVSLPSLIFSTSSGYDAVTVGDDVRSSLFHRRISGLEFDQYDPRTGLLVGRVSIPENNYFTYFPQMVRWGANGLLAIDPTRGVVEVIDHFVRRLPTADLAIQVVPPNPPAVVGQPSTYSLVVTNQGPDSAIGVFVTTPSVFSATPILLGDIAPGASIRLPFTNLNSRVGPAIQPLLVSAFTGDPNTNNNTATGFEVLPPHPDWQAILPLGARHLVAHPDGMHLLAAVASDASTSGVAVIDPVAKGVVEVLPVGADARRIAVSPDGNAIYVVLDTRSVARWNLGTHTNEFVVQSSGATIEDVLPLPGTEGLWVSAGRSRISLWKGSNVVSALSINLSAGETVRLGRQGSRIWMATPSQIQSFTNQAGLLTPVSSFSIFFGGGQQDFQTDSNYLYFSEFRLKTDTGFIESLPSSAVPWNLKGSTALIYAPFLLKNYDISAAVPVLSGQDYCPGVGYGYEARELVRWGSRGVAIRTANGLVELMESGLLSGGQADVGISVVAPKSLYFGVPGEFQVTVTNRGPESLDLATVQLVASGFAIQPTLLGQFLDPSLTGVHIGPLAAGAAYSFPIIAKVENPGSGAATVSLTATVSRGGATSTPNDLKATASASAGDAVSDLEVSLDPIDPVTVGSEVQIPCRLTNRGNQPIGGIVLKVDHSAYSVLREVDGATVTSFGDELHYVSPTPNSLPVGASQIVMLRFHADRPGLYPVQITATTGSRDTNPENNRKVAAFQLGPPIGSAAPLTSTLPFSGAQWVESRQQWVLATSYGLFFLAKETLGYQGTLPLPADAVCYQITEDGTAVWIGRTDSTLERRSLDSGLLQLTLALGTLPGVSPSAISIVPGSPDELIVFGPAKNFQLQVVAIRNGAALPATVTGNGYYQGYPLRVGVTADKTVLVSNGTVLRELSLDSDGLHLRRNLDTSVTGTISKLAVVNGRLFDGTGTSLNLTGLNRAPVEEFNFPRTGSFGSGLVRVPNSDGTASFYLGGFDIQSATRLWSIPTQNSSVVPIPDGKGNTLVLGIGNAGWVPRPAFAPPALSISAALTPRTLGLGQPVGVDVTLEQSGIWRADQSTLELDFPPSLISDPPTPERTHLQSSIDRMGPSTPLHFNFSCNRPGDQYIQFHWTCRLPDGTTATRDTEVRFTVPAAPVVLLPDVTIADDGTPFIVRLSAPTPVPVTVHLRAELIDAQASDLTALTNDVYFSAGSQESAAYWIAADNLIESNERFRVTVDPGSLPSSPASAVVTIVSRNRPSISAPSVSQQEGGSNASPAVLSLTLSQPSPIPIEIAFTTRSGTAVAGQDFSSIQGRVVFEPGVTTRRIEIPILGDSQFEPDESFWVDWWDVRNAAAPPAPTSITLLNDDPPPPPSLTAARDSAGNRVLSYDTISGMQYRLESSPALSPATWSAEGSVQRGDGKTVQVRIPETQEAERYYRLIAQ